jgi:uncharacterized protein (DUF2267 family)
MPDDVRYASQQFDEWLADLKARTLLATSNQCYSSLRAVLHEVRNHLPADVATAFGTELPPLVRGIYYEGWRPSEPPRPLASLADLTQDVMTSLSPHVIPPDTILTDVLAVLAIRLDPVRVGPVVGRFPPLLAALWKEAATKEIPRVF